MTLRRIDAFTFDCGVPASVASIASIRSRTETRSLAMSRPPERRMAAANGPAHEFS